MDWSSVTAEDLVDALREVEWSTPPRPVSEFFFRFTAPRSYSKWISRLKCNLYYFAVTFNEKVTRTVRQFSPHLAAKMRPPITPVIRGRPSKRRSIHICGQPRWVFVLLFSAVSCMLWLTSCSLLTILWALLIGLLGTLLHASFRTPNLKARLNTFREEFRAVWRNYSEL
ncbi:PRA1 family protein A1-like isoform X2 [Phragmites australis]|uniref:PRA1 family protein A1-like isoform X2 n=1 Tax=Phragmites australis TaxID=29695 RepID=UPI002D77AB26|nr:PRA1 family protein A1-like isoform X2 [Phragmites australis]